MGRLFQVSLFYCVLSPYICYISKPMQRIASICPIHFPKLSSFWENWTMREMGEYEEDRFCQIFGCGDSIKFQYYSDSIFSLKAIVNGTVFSPSTIATNLYQFSISLAAFCGKTIKVRLALETSPGNYQELDISDPIQVVQEDSRGRIYEDCAWKKVTYSSLGTSFFAGMGQYGDIDSPDIVHEVRLPMAMRPVEFPNEVQVQELIEGRKEIFTAYAGMNWELQMTWAPFWMRHLLNLIIQHHRFSIEGIQFRYVSEVQTEDQNEKNGLAISTAVVALSQYNYTSKCD